MRIFRWSVAIAATVWIAGCRQDSAGEASMAQDPKTLREEDWRRKLTPDQYAICRQKGTEPSGSGEYLHHQGDGTYRCVACGNPLFDSKTKYDACGWPSFWDQIPGSVDFDPRTLEATCAKCASHLGHVFDDGPPPTGKRY